MSAIFLRDMNIPRKGRGRGVVPRCGASLTQNARPFKRGWWAYAAGRPRFYSTLAPELFTIAPHLSISDAR